jgi:hypothetical protein
MSMIKISSILGFNQVEYSFVNWRQILAILIASNFILMLINGYIQIEPAFVNVCQASIFNSLAFELINRAINRYIFNDEIGTKKLEKKLEEFYEKYQDEHEEILFDRINLIHKVMKAFIYVYFFVGIMPVITCWILFLVTGKYVTIFPFLYPWTNSNTLTGFLLNMVITSAISLSVILLIFPNAYLMPFQGVQVIPMADIFIAKIKSWEENIVAKKEELRKLPRPNSRMSYREKYKTEILRQKALEKFNARTQKFLIDIVEFLSEYNGYIDDAIYVMTLPSFGATTVNAIFMGLSLIYLLTYSVPIGIAVLFLNFFDVFIPCLVGTIISHSNDRILDSLLNFPWYELSNSNQKIFLQIIHLCQNLKEFELPMIGTVDMELLKQIIFGTYSYFNYIMNFVEI